jgi:hypothetical protein
VGEILGGGAGAACVEGTLGEYFDVEIMNVSSPEDAAAVSQTRVSLAMQCPCSHHVPVLASLIIRT